MGPFLRSRTRPATITALLTRAVSSPSKAVGKCCAYGPAYQQGLKLLLTAGSVQLMCICGDVYVGERCMSGMRLLTRYRCHAFMISPTSPSSSEPPWQHGAHCQLCSAKLLSMGGKSSVVGEAEILNDRWYAMQSQLNNMFLAQHAVLHAKRARTVRQLLAQKGVAEAIGSVQDKKVLQIARLEEALRLLGETATAWLELRSLLRSSTLCRAVAKGGRFLQPHL